jgi:hypothetical protein
MARRTVPTGLLATGACVAGSCSAPVANLPDPIEHAPAKLAGTEPSAAPPTTTFTWHEEPITDEPSCKHRCNGQWGLWGMHATVPSCNCAVKDGGKPCRSPRECSSYCDVGWEEALSAQKVSCDRDSPLRCTGGRMPRGHCAEYVSRDGCFGWLVEATEAGTGHVVIRTKWLCTD